MQLSVDNGNNTRNIEWNKYTKGGLKIEDFLKKYKIELPEINTIEKNLK